MPKEDGSIEYSAKAIASSEPSMIDAILEDLRDNEKQRMESRDLMRVPRSLRIRRQSRTN